LNPFQCAPDRAIQLDREVGGREMTEITPVKYAKPLINAPQYDFPNLRDKLRSSLHVPVKQKRQYGLTG